MNISLLLNPSNTKQNNSSVTKKESEAVVTLSSHFKSTSIFLPNSVQARSEHFFKSNSPTKKPKPVRRLLRSDQKEYLVRIFKHNRSPTAQQIRGYSIDTGVSPEQIKNWFATQRTKRPPTHLVMPCQRKLVFCA